MLFVNNFYFATYFRNFFPKTILYYIYTLLWRRRRYTGLPLFFCPYETKQIITLFSVTTKHSHLKFYRNVFSVSTNHSFCLKLKFVILRIRTWTYIVQTGQKLNTTWNLWQISITYQLLVTYMWQFIDSLNLSVAFYH